MPHPIFHGRLIKEVIVPAKSVFQYDCSRCRRTWYEKEEKPVGSLALRMNCSDGTTLDGAFETLCRSCEKTVRTYIENVLKLLSKMSSDKPRAKKEGPEPSVQPSQASTVSDVVPENTPRVAGPLPPPSPSKRQSAH